VTPVEFSPAAVFVGDLPSDMQLAREAGVLAIGRWSGATADSLIAEGAHHVIRDLTELEPLLNRLNADRPVVIATPTV
jgi:phosphoglycolate phosphatase-like HAD superfamily hydrolase